MFYSDVDYIGPVPDNYVSSEPFLYEVVSLDLTNTVTLVEFKAHLNIDFNDDDTLLQSMITASILEAEKYCNLSLGKRNIKTYRDRFFYGGNKNDIDSDYRKYMTIFRRSFISVSNIQYLDTDNVLNTLDPSIYYVQKTQDYPFICVSPGKRWPDNVSERLGSIIIEFTTGMLNVPEDLKLAVKQIGANFYANRGDDSSDVMPIPRHCKTILDQHRRIRL